MLDSDGLAGLQMGLGIRVRWALEGKQTKRSAEGGPLFSLPFMVFFSLSLSLFLFLLVLLCQCVSMCLIQRISDLVLVIFGVWGVFGLAF